MKPRIAIILTHPIQYHSPLFQQLAQRAVVEIKVFYTLGQDATGKLFDRGFGKVVQWDIPLLEGYDYEFLTNTSRRPDTYHLRGIINPDAIAKIELYKPNAVLIFGWAFVSHLMIMRHFKNRIPVLFRGDSTLLKEKAGMKTMARYWFLRWVYRYVDKALYVGKNNYEYYVKFGLQTDQLVWAPHVVDNKRFGEPGVVYRQKAHELRKALQIPASHYVFLFAGKLEPTKDPLLLLEAFKTAGFDETVHLVFAGNGVLETNLKTRAQAVQRVHFMDFQNQQVMPALYRLADVFVLPSVGETWGLAVNEAMACARAVMVSDQCGCAPDLVEDAVNGYMFRAGNLNDLVSKMELMFRERSRLPSMQDASLHKISSYSMEAVCQTLETLVCTM